MANATAAGRFRGPQIVAAAFLLNAVAIGATHISFGFFVGPLEKEFGASRAQLLLGVSALNVVMALVAPMVGRVVDRGSPRAMMIAGAAALTAGLAVMSRATALWQLGFVLVALVALGGALFGPVPTTTVIANWYGLRRGTAIGIASTGSTAAGVLLPPLLASLLLSIGWRDTMAVLGLGVAVLALPVIALFVVRRPEDIGQKPDGEAVAAPRAEAVPVDTSGILRQPAFWLLGVAIGLVGGILTTFSPTVVPYATHLGNDLRAAAVAPMVTAGFALLGKLLFGALFDRVNRRLVLGLWLGVQGAGWAILASQPSYLALLGGFALWALGAGGILPLHGALIGAIFGRAVFGRVLGMMSLVSLPFGAALPPLAGHLYDASGSYDTTFAWGAALYATAAVLIAIGYWRGRSGFVRHAFAANTVLMTGGFILVGYQLAGYIQQ